MWNYFIKFHKKSFISWRIALYTKDTFNCNIVLPFTDFHNWSKSFLLKKLLHFSPWISQSAEPGSFSSLNIEHCEKKHLRELTQIQTGTWECHHQRLEWRIVGFVIPLLFCVIFLQHTFHQVATTVPSRRKDIWCKT